MNGHRPPFRGRAGGGGQRRRDQQQPPFPSPSQLPDLSVDPSLFLQNVAFQQYPNFLFQNPQQNFNGPFPFQQYPNFPFQNPNMPLPYQFPNDFAQQHDYSSAQQQAENITPQQSQSSHPRKGEEVIDVSEKNKQRVPPQQSQKLPRKNEEKEKQLLEGGELESQSSEKKQAQNLPVQNPKLVKYQRHFTKHLAHDGQSLISRVDKAVEKAWGDLLASGETVSSWKVSQAALVTLQVDSWDSLGFRMQEVPSLHRLILVEGKINSFIHCFVGVRRITSLHDLEVAICENEGIERFEELGLGPLLRHPLVVHYFLVNSDVTEVVKITAEDIILSLHDFMTNHNKKDVIVDEFLYFLAKKKSTKGVGNLGVRIQSLGMHISFIREATRSMHATLSSCLKKMKAKSGDEILRASAKGSGNEPQKRRPFTPEKKILDERFSAMSQRLESFASVHKDFRGKHIRFDSSGSEDDESDDGTDEDNMNNDDDHNCFPLQKVHNTDRVSTCPYPSATEEISRLGLKGELQSQSPPVGSSSTRKRLMQRKNKRKRENESCTTSAPAKLLKGKNGRHSMLAIGCGNSTEKVKNKNEPDFSLSDSSIKMFITTWKETCKEHSLAEVIERMIGFTNFGDGAKAARRQKGFRKHTKKLFSSGPWNGLLNVAVTAIKSDMFDSIYCAFDSIQNELPGTLSEYESIDVEQSEKQTSFVSCTRLQQMHSVTFEEILGKISEYYNLHSKSWRSSKSLLEDMFISLKKLCSCEFWLLDQFSVKEFESLDFGDFFGFLEKHATLLPAEVQKLFAVDIFAKPPLEVSVLQNQLMLLVSQAAANLWEDEPIAKQMISSLLLKQFPLLSFRIVENGSKEDFLKVLGEYKSNGTSNCVLYSATLVGKKFVVDAQKEDQNIRIVGVESNSNEKMAGFETITSKNAIEVLLKAPMLFDLNSWSHWDLIFAPSLGPLVGWLSSEVNAKELLCLVTKDGKVMRINESANADSFLEAALQISAYQTAVELLSLLSLAGGEKQVPLLLLKSYARQAFDVISKTHFENVELQDKKNFIYNEKVVDGVDKEVVDSANVSAQTSKWVHAASRYVLDCLGYLPSEFLGFVADILLSGMQSVIKDAPYAILCECNKKERIMLHEVGLSIGIVEWVDDYQKFRAGGFMELSISTPAHSRAARPSGAGSSYMHNRIASSSLEEDVHEDETSEIHRANHCALRSIDEIGNSCAIESSESKTKDAALVIESIRKYEFGLDPNLSCSESTMLEKQHARLGRALHCLSQELYSEDSHFLLELVQNADDNIYPESVEPTLTFILQESSIVVLNNERGFSEKNIRALCDVGNSTKKGSGTGYIGQKGIGFKSVFRVTDAPEIHSNGFHIKFDISGGQIGFVLPTVVAPCNIESYSRLISQGPVNRNMWNTCILLPFRSKLSEETAMKMFSDLHASLLLFLHRLQCIMFRNMLNDSLLVMRKKILQDGIVKVSCGKYKMTWLVESQKLPAHRSRPKVQTTEISMAFPLEELDNGEYSALLELQPVFSFLPLRTYGLKFILHGDFVLPSSRQEVDKNDPWNEWLLTKFPGLFVKAERSFCALSCFRDNPGKAVSTYMSFVPLVGEVHDFFSGLPKVIALELRRTSCLLLEGDNCKMVPPCNVLRGWNEQARELLSVGLLQEHLGLGFLDRNIILSDSLARALGIAEYGPEILIKFITCLCRTKSGLESMGLGWLSSFLNALYMMLSQSSGLTGLIDSLKKIPFIPLSDGTYSAVDEGTIWLHSDSVNAGFCGTQELEAFPQLYAKLRIVNPAIFVASASDRTLADNTARMLQKIGAQLLSAHEILKVHILPAMSVDEILTKDKDLITDYLCFVMIHLQSSCPSCFFEREYIISKLQTKAYILTNFGYRRLADTSIHFSEEFGNPINIKKLISNMGMKWYEVNVSYLKHPVNSSLSDGLLKWRSFLQEVGITDFVQVVQTEKNISDLNHAVLKDITWDADLVSSGLVAKDWESPELEQILSLLCSTGDGERCKYLLEVLDTLWDDYLSGKATGVCNSKSGVEGRAFKSSFLRSIHDAKWVVSSMDNKLHYPKDLFHDCDMVRSLLGGYAPYSRPKVRSTKLVSDIGLKTEVTLSDALGILKAWSDLNKPFKASIAQMSKFYLFILGEMVGSKKQVSEALHSMPFVFVPYESVSRHGDVVSGVFLPVEEVYWHDPTGCVDFIKEIHSQKSFTGVSQHPLVKALCNVYAGLYDFFVKECKVCEVPSCHGYLDILQQLSKVSLPSQAAGQVFQVFLKWADGITSGSLSSGEITAIKECLMKVEYAVLPTVLDKWVSLHPSFSTICWCDDKNLKKMFKEMDGIDFLYFGNSSEHEEDVRQSKVSVLLQDLGIPALSKMITREAIFYGPADSSFKASLIDWALPYAQRYIYSVHSDTYRQLKQSEFSIIKQLKVTVVEKLFYRNTLKSSGTASKKRYECNCLLQGNTLYATSECDSHALFLELSCLFFSGASDLHLANFLHMITTMVESGSTEDQIEFFITNSQKMPKAPEEESVWSLSSISSAVENDGPLQPGVELTALHNPMASKSKKKSGISSSWPPADWKTAPGFEHGYRTNAFLSQAALLNRGSTANDEENNLVDVEEQNDTSEPFNVDADWMIEENMAAGSNLLETENLVNNSAPAKLPVDCCDAEPLPIISAPEPNPSRFNLRENLQTGKPNQSEVLITGRVGEKIAFKYLAQKFKGKVVRWVNEDNETGLPYDIVVEEGEDRMEYFEVKATRSARKDWFNITKREWQFAAEKQESFSIAHVILLSNNAARVTLFRNPVKQCQTGKLQLVIMMPKDVDRIVVS